METKIIIFDEMNGVNYKSKLCQYYESILKINGIDYKLVRNDKELIEEIKKE